MAFVNTKIPRDYQQGTGRLVQFRPIALGFRVCILCMVSGAEENSTCRKQRNA